MSLLGVKWFSLGTGCHVWILHLRHSCQLLHQELHMEKVIEPLYHPLFKKLFTKTTEGNTTRSRFIYEKDRTV